MYMFKYRHLQLICQKYNHSYRKLTAYQAAAHCTHSPTRTHSEIHTFPPPKVALVSKYLVAYTKKL